MIKRRIAPDLKRAAREYRVVRILGLRQSGKTTLARKTFPTKAYFSLENPDVRMVAEADPRDFFGQAPAGAILDKVQRLPVLLFDIQGIVDQNRRPGQFILTGIHQPQLH